MRLEKGGDATRVGVVTLHANGERLETTVRHVAVERRRNRANGILKELQPGVERLGLGGEHPHHDIRVTVDVL
jgi:hypothetical protein